MRNLILLLSLGLLCGCDGAYFETPPPYEPLDTLLRVPPPKIVEPPSFIVDDGSQPAPIPQNPMCLGAAIAEPYQRTAPTPFPDELTLAEINQVIATLRKPETTFYDCTIRICGDSYTYVGEATTDWIKGPVVVTCSVIFTDQGERMTQFVINGQQYVRRSLHTEVLKWWQTYPGH